MANENMPQISATLGLDKSIYSISSNDPPELKLTVTSHHTEPITIFADDLSPRLMIRTGSVLTITDLSNNKIVKQTRRTHCRIPPPSHVAVPLEESQFHTLFPGQPLTLSAPFQGSRSGTTAGVDGLETGHRYMIGLSGSQRLQWNRICWWEYGTKEEILAKGLDGREVLYGKGPHEAILVDISAIEPIYLECKD